MTTNTIKRKGNYISIDKGITATEGGSGNMPTLTIRRNGKVTDEYRGSSLCFSKPLTAEDKSYLNWLAKGE